MTIAEKIARAKADYDDVYEAGKKAEWNAFWDAFQRNGTKADYFGAFNSFNRDAFFPKYNIILKDDWGAQQTFRVFPDSSMSASADFDLVARLNECGITLDTSGVTAMYQTFYFSCVSTIPTLDLSNCNNILYQTFSFCTRLHTIEKIILSDGTQVFENGCFEECQKLQNIIFEGVIGSNINFQWSASLSKASVQSIVGALSTTASGKTLTLSKTAVNNAFTTAEWTALADTRSNWTISLV